MLSQICFLIYPITDGSISSHNGNPRDFNAFGNARLPGPVAGRGIASQIAQGGRAQFNPQSAQSGNFSNRPNNQWAVSSQLGFQNLAENAAVGVASSPNLQRERQNFGAGQPQKVTVPRGMAMANRLPSGNELILRKPLSAHGRHSEKDSYASNRKRDRSKSRSTSPSTHDGRAQRRRVDAVAKTFEASRSESHRSDRPERPSKFADRSSKFDKRMPSASRFSSKARSLSSSEKVVEISNRTVSDLIENFNIPALARNLRTINLMELKTKFPNLYVPADFIELKIDWESFVPGLNRDFLWKILLPAPLQFENTPCCLKLKKEQFKFDSVEFHSDILDPPKYSYLDTPHGVSVSSFESLRFPDKFLYPKRPIKFNAKIMVTCGIKDFETERIDHNLIRKLR